MPTDLRFFVAALIIGSIVFSIYSIIHHYAAKDSDERLKVHKADAMNEWIEREDLNCCVQAAFFIEVDADGNYLYRRDTSMEVDLSDSFAFRDRVAKLQRIVEARLGRIPSRIYFDKEAWRQVKEDRARWQDIAHFCRKTQASLSRGIQQQSTINS